MSIEKIHQLVNEEGIVFLAYGGFLSQSLIANMAEALEREASLSDLCLNDSNNIFTIFIELAQNMMNYSKTLDDGCEKIKSEGLIVVGKIDDDVYFIQSQNIVSKEDKFKIDSKLKEIKSLDKLGIKKRYKELRRSGENTHEKGGGIGFYEIGKRLDRLEYKFEPISEDKYYFQFKAFVEINKESK